MNVTDYISLGALVLVVAYSGFHEFIRYQSNKESKSPDELKTITDKLAIIDQYAYPIVTSIAVNPLIPKSDSKAAAVKIMRDKLSDVGINNVTDDTINRVIESAYQSYKANGGKTNVNTTQVSDDKIAATLNEPQSLPGMTKGDENNG